MSYLIPLAKQSKFENAADIKSQFQRHLLVSLEQKKINRCWIYNVTFAPRFKKSRMQSQYNLSFLEHLASLITYSDSFIRSWHWSRFLTLSLRDLTSLMLSRLWKWWIFNLIFETTSCIRCVPRGSMVPPLKDRYGLRERKKKKKKHGSSQGLQYLTGKSRASVQINIRLVLKCRQFKLKFLLRPEND